MAHYIRDSFHLLGALLMILMMRQTQFSSALAAGWMQFTDSII